jgi:hypothetical protein
VSYFFITSYQALKEYLVENAVRLCKDSNREKNIPRRISYFLKSFMYIDVSSKLKKEVNYNATIAERSQIILVSEANKLVIQTNYYTWNLKMHTILCL